MKLAWTLFLIVAALAGFWILALGALLGAL